MQDTKEIFDARQHCKTTQFRPDINDLCESCGLRQIIIEGMKNAIISQAQQQKEVLTDSQFEAYCKRERENAQQAMMKANHLIGRDKTSQTFAVSFPGVTHHHIWNKERIKALNQLQALKPAYTAFNEKDIDKPTPDTSTTPVIDLPPKSNKVEIRPFPELLAGSYSKDDLDRMLIHLRMKDIEGNSIWPQNRKSALHGVIEALCKKNFLIETTQKERMSSLSTYLDLGNTRVKEGHSKIQSLLTREQVCKVKRDDLCFCRA